MSSKHLLRCEVNTYLHKHTFKVFSPVAVSACLCARAHVYVHVCVCSSGESSASALRQVCPLRKGPLTAQSALDWEPINQGSHWDEHTHMHTHLCSQTYIRCLKWLMKGEGKDFVERRTEVLKGLIILRAEGRGVAGEWLHWDLINWHRFRLTSEELQKTDCRSCLCSEDKKVH